MDTLMAELVMPLCICPIATDMITIQTNGTVINDNYFFPSTTIKIPVPHSL